MQPPKAYLAPNVSGEGGRYVGVGGGCGFFDCLGRVKVERDCVFSFLAMASYILRYGALLTSKKLFLGAKKGRGSGLLGFSRLVI